MNLIKKTKFMSAVTPTAGVAGTSAINGTTLDVQGFEGIIAYVRFGAIVAGAVTSVKIQHGDASDLSDAADITGSSVTVADTDDEKAVVINLHRPLKRYVRVVVSRGTQNATVSEAHYQLYDARKAPTTHDTSVTAVLVTV